MGAKGRRIARAGSYIHGSIGQKDGASWVLYTWIQREEGRRELEAIYMVVKGISRARDGFKIHVKNGSDLAQNGFVIHGWNRDIERYRCKKLDGRKYNIGAARCKLRPWSI